MTGCYIGPRQDVEWRVDPTDDVRSNIEAMFSIQKTLEDVVRWGLGQKTPQMIRDIVIQDEYTHDVILPHSSGYWLVYDVT